MMLLAVQGLFPALQMGSRALSDASQVAVNDRAWWEGVRVRRSLLRLETRFQPSLGSLLRRFGGLSSQA
jgi:hypothetical protein